MSERVYFECGYVHRSKRIKNPWLDTCDECGTHPISYDITERPADPEPGTCYVESIPWRTQNDQDDQDDTGSGNRYLLACPNGCTAWPYQRRTKRIKNPGCTPVPSVTQHSSVTTATTAPPTSNPDAVTW